MTANLIRLTTKTNTNGNPTTNGTGNGYAPEHVEKPAPDFPRSRTTFWA